MRGRPSEGGPEAVKVNEGKRSLMRRWMQLGLTGRMFLLVVIAVLPALVIQAVNEYALRTSREDEIRQRVIQITKQFGEEIQAIRAGASQLLIALGELDEVQKHDTPECGATFAKLKARFESYVRIGAADATGKVFCSTGTTMEASVADTEFFKRAIVGDGLAAGVDGIMRIFGYNPAQLPPKDFFLSAGQSKVEAMEPIEAATKRGILLILLGLLAAMYLAWVGGRRFIKRPIANLLEGTSEWG